MGGKQVHDAPVDRVAMGQHCCGSPDRAPLLKGARRTVPVCEHRDLHAAEDRIIGSFVPTNRALPE